MTLLVKLGLGVLGLGTTGAAGYGVYELIRPRTIADQLKWEGKELGDVEGTSDDDQTNGLWKKLKDKYSSETSSHPEKQFKKILEADSNPTISDGTKLKEHCKKILILELSESNKDHLDKARFWCVRNSEKLNQQ